MPLEIAGETQWFGGRYYIDVILSFVKLIVTIIMIQLDTKIMRPMKDMLSKEIGLYNQFLHLDSVFIPSLTTMLPPKASIERLTEG